MGIWLNNYFSAPPPGMEGECGGGSLLLAIWKRGLGHLLGGEWRPLSSWGGEMLAKCWIAVAIDSRNVQMVAPFIWYAIKRIGLVMSTGYVWPGRPIALHMLRVDWKLAIRYTTACEGNARHSPPEQIPRAARTHVHLKSLVSPNAPKTNPDPNAMELGPPSNDVTAPPTSGGLGMIPTGLAAAGRRATRPREMTVGGGEFDAGGHETTFSSGGTSSSEPEGGKGGGWWPFGGGS